jgi:hypothetical protein
MDMPDGSKKLIQPDMTRQRSELPNETLSSSWDIVQAIGSNFRLHLDLSLFHVK